MGNGGISCFGPSGTARCGTLGSLGTSGTSGCGTWGSFGTVYGMAFQASTTLAWQGAAARALLSPSTRRGVALEDPLVSPA